MGKSRLVVGTLLLVLAASGALAAQKNVPRGAQLVDSGSYGIFISGTRVATESFTIHQHAGGSISHVELRVAGSDQGARESSELHMAANGDLVRYQWNEAAPGKAQATVEPSDVFLVGRVSMNPAEKPVDLPYLLPHSTVILDDYIFTHRQILAWRYMAGGCRPSEGKLECNLARAQFGALVPRQRISVSVGMEFAGREKVNIRGAERELNRFNLSMEGEEWTLWLDDANKMVRVLVPAHHTEVVRD